MRVIIDILEKYGLSYNDELEEVIANVASRHNIGVRNIGNEAMGFIPEITFRDGNADELYGAFYEDLERTLKNPEDIGKAL